MQMTQQEKVKFLLKRVLDFAGKNDRLHYIRGRWADESEYEDFKEYDDAIRKVFVDAGYVVHSVTKAFAITVEIEGVKFVVKINLGSVKVSACERFELTEEEKAENLRKFYKKLERKAVTLTLFRFEGDKEHSWRQMNGTSQSVYDRIVAHAKATNKKVEFFRDRKPIGEPSKLMVDGKEFNLQQVEAPKMLVKPSPDGGLSVISEGKLDDATLKRLMKEAKDGQKKADANPNKKRTIASIAYEAIGQGKTDEQVIAAVKAIYPSASTSSSCIRWYRNKLKQTA